MVGKSCKTSKSRQFGTICCFKENDDRINNLGSHKNSSRNFQNANEIQLQYETGTNVYRAILYGKKKILLPRELRVLGGKLPVKFFLFFFFLQRPPLVLEKKKKIPSLKENLTSKSYCCKTKQQ